MQVTYTGPPALSYRHPRSYGRGAIAFHWTVALLLILVGLLGLLHDSWPKRSHEFWINIHALFGLVLWAAVLARFCWRVAHTPHYDGVKRGEPEPAVIALFGIAPVDLSLIDPSKPGWRLV